MIVFRRISKVSVAKGTSERADNEILSIVRIAQSCISSRPLLNVVEVGSLVLLRESNVPHMAICTSSRILECESCHGV